VVVEAESSRIGNVSVPPAVWASMRAAPRIEVAAPVDARADYLARAYADVTADGARLADRLVALTPMQGKERVAEWLALAQAGAFRDLAAGLVTHHYDPRYAKSRARHPAPVARVEAEALDDVALDALAVRLAASVHDQMRRA
jgi:tRNA 2-selenouridine synthase